MQSVYFCITSEDVRISGDFRRILGESHVAKSFKGTSGKKNARDSVLHTVPRVDMPLGNAVAGRLFSQLCCTQCHPSGKADLAAPAARPEAHTFGNHPRTKEM